MTSWRTRTIGLFPLVAALLMACSIGPISVSLSNTPTPTPTASATPVRPTLTPTPAIAPTPTLKSTPTATIAPLPMLAPTVPSPTATGTARAVPTPTASPTLAPSPTATPETHTVAAGETLSKIAREHNCDMLELAAYNGIANPSLVQVGQVLTIPPADYTVPADLIASWTATAQAAPTATTVPQVPLTAIVEVPTATPVPQVVPTPTTRVCCKICTTGKACGDTCINRNYTCHKGPGCACNAY